MTAHERRTELARILDMRMRRHHLTTHGVAELTRDLLRADICSDTDPPEWTGRYVEAVLDTTRDGAALMIDAIDTYEGIPEPLAGTESLPGSEERIAEYAARFERGESVFSRLDATVAL
jgi:hypothetical protein